MSDQPCVLIHLCSFGHVVFVVAFQYENDYEPPKKINTQSEGDLSQEYLKPKKLITSQQLKAMEEDIWHNLSNPAVKVLNSQQQNMSYFAGTVHLF